MTWATVLQQPKPPPPQQRLVEGTAAPGGTTAVLDTSAIIAGFDRKVADTLTTISDVLNECKDAVSKQRLQLLPEGISIQQPSAESLKRGE